MNSNAYVKSNGADIAPVAIPPLSEQQQQRLGEMFRLLGEPSRLRILLACQETPRCVCDIAQESGLSPSLVSQHLRLLRAGNLVACERDGKHVFYRVADRHVFQMLSVMAEHANHEWREPLEELE